MPTAAEKKALVFLAAVAVAGAAVRMTHAVSQASAADAGSREALRRQIVSAESAGAVERRARRNGGKNATATRQNKNTQRSEAPESSFVAPGIGFNGPNEADPRNIFNPPPAPPPSRRHKQSPPSSPIDVDRATAAELEALPRIGPALAARIVADRETNGPFGSLDGFQRVRGVGPAMARALSSSVTFSGTPRPSFAGGARPGASIDARANSRRRKAPP